MQETLETWVRSLGWEIPEGGHGNPLQYSGLENPHGQGSLAGCSPPGHKESDSTERLGAAQHSCMWWNERRVRGFLRADTGALHAVCHCEPLEASRNGKSFKNLMKRWCGSYQVKILCRNEDKPIMPWEATFFTLVRSQWLWYVSRESLSDGRHPSQSRDAVPAACTPHEHCVSSSL